MASWSRELEPAELEQNWWSRPKDKEDESPRNEILAQMGTVLFVMALVSFVIIIFGVEIMDRGAMAFQFRLP